MLGMAGTGSSQDDILLCSTYVLIFSLRDREDKVKSTAEDIDSYTASLQSV